MLVPLAVTSQRKCLGVSSVAAIWIACLSLGGSQTQAQSKSWVWLYKMLTYGFRLHRHQSSVVHGSRGDLLIQEPSKWS